MHHQAAPDRGSPWWFKPALVGASLIVFYAGYEIGLASEAAAQDAEASEAAISSVLVALRNIIIAIGTGLAALAFTVGGVMYMTATGSPQQMESGKTAMKSAVIGLVIVFIGYIFIDFLHGTLTNATGDEPGSGS